MESKDLNEVLEIANQVVQNNDWRAKDYVPNEQLAMWLVRVYEDYYKRKVITERIHGHQDISVILSDTKLSVILNETGQASSAQCVNLMAYNNIEEDLVSAMEVLDIAILRAELN